MADFEYCNYKEYLKHQDDFKFKLKEQLLLIQFATLNKDKGFSKLHFSKYQFVAINVDKQFSFIIAPTNCILNFINYKINADLIYNVKDDSFYLIRKNKKINIKLGNIDETLNKIINFKLIEKEL